MRMPASRAWCANSGVLREADAVGGRLHAEVPDLARVADRVEEDRRNRRLAAGELHRHLPPRLDADRIVEQLLDLVQRQLVHVADLIGVHEARIAHHVAAVGQVDRQHRAAAVLDGRGAVIVQRVGDRVGKSRPGNSDSSRRRNAGLMASVSVNVPCVGQVFSMTTLPSRSKMCALISPACSLTSESSDCSPERIRARVSRTHVGQSESVVRGQPS